MVGPDHSPWTMRQRYYSAFFVAEEHHVELPGGVRGDPGQGPVLSLTPTMCQPLLEHARGRRQGGQDTPTQVGRALAQLGIELIPAYSPEARGRSERMFGTLQKRLPRNSGSPASPSMVEANRFLKEVFLPQHNARFATPAEDRGTVVSPARSIDILCIHEERRSQTTNGALQAPGTSDPRRPPPPPLRQSRVRVHEYPDGTILPWTAMSGAIPRRWPTDRQPNARPRDPLRRDRPAPCGQVDSRSATELPHRARYRNRSTHMVHKPVNLNVIDRGINSCRRGQGSVFAKPLYA